MNVLAIAHAKDGMDVPGVGELNVAIWYKTVTNPKGTLMEPSSGVPTPYGVVDDLRWSKTT